jgi:phage internal scaffolding protein
MSKYIVRGAYGYDEESFSNVGAVEDFGPSLALQSQREDADINTIVKRFGLTGEIPQNVRLPTYGDFVGISDYHAAMNAIGEANSSFQLLPADIRSRFDNDPGKFVDFCSDPDNIDGLREMGLAKPKQEVKSDGNVQRASEDAGAAGEAPGGGSGGDAAKPGAGAKG